MSNPITFDELAEGYQSYSVSLDHQESIAEQIERSKEVISFYGDVVEEVIKDSTNTSYSCRNDFLVNCSPCKLKAVTFEESTIGWYYRKFDNNHVTGVIGCLKESGVEVAGIRELMSLICQYTEIAGKYDNLYAPGAHILYYLNKENKGHMYADKKVKWPRLCPTENEGMIDFCTVKDGDIFKGDRDWFLVYEPSESQEFS